MADTQSEPRTTSPVMCSLSPGALKAGRDNLLPGLRGRADHVTVAEDGVTLTFTASSENLTAITRAIDAERQCCQWLRFELAVTPDGGPFVLTLRAPIEGHEFLSTLLDS